MPVPPEASPDDTRTVVHDLNNLLTAVIGAAEAVLHRSGVDGETAADAAHIREGARRGAALVRRLHGAAPDNAADVLIDDWIRSFHRLLGGPGVTVTLELAAPHGKAVIDPTQFDRVLLNLAANARQAMAGGGVIRVATRRSQLSASEPGVPDSVPAGDYVAISLADSGAGIPPEQLARVFERGVTSRRDAGGSGLGLASAHDIVRAAGGFLTVTSVVDGGTTFVIWLPLAEAAAVGFSGGMLAEPATAIATRTVLLVEDDALVRAVAERTLRRAGWYVLSAGSAEAALAMLDDTPCDLMISDVALPGMDGVALARQVLARHPGLPVILSSGYASASVEDELAVATVAFLSKPYGQRELLAAVARIASAGNGK